jgi:hypothetical protein
MISIRIRLKRTAMRSQKGRFKRVTGREDLEQRREKRGDYREERAEEREVKRALC